MAKKAKKFEETKSGQAITNWTRSHAYWYNRDTGRILDAEKCKGKNKNICPIVTNKRILDSIQKRIDAFDIKRVKIKRNKR